MQDRVHVGWIRVADQLAGVFGEHLDQRHTTFSGRSPDVVENREPARVSGADDQLSARPGDRLSS